MDLLFQNQYLRIAKTEITHCLEIEITDFSYNKEVTLEQIEKMADVVKKNHAKKILFKAHDMIQLGNEAVIINDFIPKLADAGIQHYAVVTGYHEPAKVFFHEFAKCLEPIKKQYHLTTEQFSDDLQARAWLKTQ